MANYKLSKLAQQDILAIAQYGYETYGIVQAEAYKTELKACLQHIAENPYLYVAIDHIKLGHRRCIFRPHTIYYKIIPSNDVLIVRILGRQEPGQALKEK